MSADSGITGLSGHTPSCTALRRELDRMAIAPEAIEQRADVDVNEVVVRPTAQR